MPLKTDTVQDARDARALLHDVEYYLARALAAAIQADAPQMVRRLRSDIKAVGGALRHVQGRVQRAEDGKPMRRRGL